MLDVMHRAQAVKSVLAGDAAVSRAERFRLTRYPAALLAALLSQLRSSDTLLLDRAHPLLEQLLSSAAERPSLHISGLDSRGTALLAAGVALREKALFAGRSKGGSGVVFALLDREPEDLAWMQVAQQHLLPLIVIARASGGQRPPGNDRKPAQVPTMLVDDADAVALCRVLQESRLRAEHGWSSVDVRALHFEHGTDAVEALESHLRQRGVVT